MDQELIAYLDERFRESSRQIKELREETMSRFEGVDEATRHTQDGVRHAQVMVEGLRSDLQAVAEGGSGCQRED